MNELEIMARMVASRLKTDFPFIFDRLDEFYERIELWQKEIASPTSSDDLKLKFDKFRKAYPGVKRGLDVEYANFIKKYLRGAGETIDKLLPALQREIAYHNRCKREGRFCPEYQHLKTWINNRSWETVFPEPIVNSITAPETRKYVR